MIAACALLPGVIGCATAAPVGEDRTAVLLTEVPARHTACVALPEPERIPAAHELVDTLRLGQVVREIEFDPPIPDAYVLFSLAYDRGGTNIRREVIEHRMPTTMADSIQRVLFRNLLPVPEREAEWGVRFRVAATPELRFDTGRREFCPPRPRDPRLEATMAEFQPAGVRYRRGARERVVRMRAWVDPTGRITTAHVLQGAAPGSTLERDLATFVRQYSFVPATIDGFPAGAWVEIPVRVPG